TRLPVVAAQLIGQWTPAPGPGRAAQRRPVLGAVAEPDDTDRANPPGTPRCSSSSASPYERPKRQLPTPASTAASSAVFDAMAASMAQNFTGHASSCVSPNLTLSGSQ